MVGIGAAARADDVTAGVEQGRVLARHGLRPQLVGHGVARGHRQPSVRIRDQRRVGDLAHVADDDDGAVGPTPTVHADDVGAGAQEILGHLARALAPHGAVAVVHLFVLEKHRRHHRQVSHRLAGANRRGRLLGKHHRLDGEDVHAALGQRLGLLAERRLVLLVGHALVEGIVLGQPAGRPDGAGHVASRRRRGSGQPRALLVQLARAITDLILVELEPGASERVGLDDVAAGVEVALMDPADDVGVGVVPQLGAGAVQEPGGEEHGAVPAVEDERLAAANALDDFPAACLHRATPTPSSCLALTTACVESLA